MRRTGTMMVRALLAGCAHAGETPSAAPLAVHGSTATLEIAPVLLAARDHYPAGALVRPGGIGNLIGEGPRADLATHAETQALRYSVAHPELRIILTVTEGRYRVVARRSAGIATLGDLKGKRVATLLATSAGYFLARMLGEAGLGIGDVEPVRLPVEAMAGALARREVDAVAIWEPHAGNAARALDDDRVEFAGDGVYRELFNLNATADSLADPARRRRIVGFVRAILDAAAAIRRDGAPARELVGAIAGFPAEEVARAWPTLAFTGELPSDLLDALVAEEAWLAGRDGRPARTREALARLIDSSILEEARRR